MEVKTCDRESYLDKRRKLKDSLKGIYNCQTGSYIVSLSRKGPRLLEKIFEDCGNSNCLELNTVTEFALPFIYYNIAQKMASEEVESFSPTIYVVDDAVYYGSTIEGLWNEMKKYERLYHLEGKIDHHVHACIKSKRSKPLDEMNIQAERDIPDGYEHYFVKNLVADLRSLHKCLEVEFPIVTYYFDEIIHIDALVQQICDVYGEKRTYRIDFPDFTQANSIRNISSVNVLLDKGDAIFNKMRIIVTEHEVRIACMAPRNILMSYYSLRSMFLTTEVNDIWKWALSVPSTMIANISPSLDSINDYEGLMHNVMKSVVTLCNYFYSYNTIIEQKSTLMSIFTSMNYHPEFKGVDERDVFYLIGDREKSQSVQRVFLSLYQEGKLLEPQIQSVGNVDIDYQVFETGFPKGLIEGIDIQNKRLIENCHNAQETLSAIFYNQTLLLENGTRSFKKKDDNTRLRFGQTFGSLYKNVSKFPIDSTKVVHKWVDRNIDLGCIVPQYVLDRNTNYWTRVFRPGENEDAVLGQLSRLAVFCYTNIDKIVGAGWLPESLLSDMLSAVFLNSMFDLNRELGLNLSCANRKLYFQFEDLDSPTEVMDYLKRMSVFDEKGTDILISKSLEQFDIGACTSMGEEVDREISTFVKNVATRCQQESLSIFEASYYTNVFFINKESLNDIKRLYNEAHEFLLKWVEELETVQDKNTWLQQNPEAEFLKHYYDVDKLLVKSLFWRDFKEHDNFSRSSFEILETHIANYLMVADSLLLIICMNDLKSFRDVAGWYYDSSWGIGVISTYYLDRILSVYNNSSFDVPKKEQELLKAAKSLLLSMMN